MNKGYGVDYSKGRSKTVIGVFGGNGLEAVYEAGGIEGLNDTFDIAPSHTGDEDYALCHKCTFFVKEGNCTLWELQQKAANVKLYSCKKFFDKPNIQRMGE